MHNAMISTAASQWCLPEEITYHIGQYLNAQETLHLTSTCKALFHIRFPLHPLHFKSPLKIETFLAHLGQLENQQAGCDPVFFSNRFTAVTKIHIHLSSDQSTDHIDALTQKLPNITVLSLDVDSSITSAQFENFCDALKNFRHLTHIQLVARDDYLETENPSALWVFARLHQLTINNFQCTVLSSKIWQLKQLQTLTINCLCLRTLPPEIGQLNQLQTLTISGAKLTTLPTEIGPLKQLQTLTIQWCSKLTTLPAEIGQLNQLQTLTIEYCLKLTTLPEEIFELAQRNNLDLPTQFQREQQ